MSRLAVPRSATVGRLRVDLVGEYGIRIYLATLSVVLRRRHLGDWSKPDGAPQENEKVNDVGLRSGNLMEGDEETLLRSINIIYNTCVFIPLDWNIWTDLDVVVQPHRHSSCPSKLCPKYSGSHTRIERPSCRLWSS